MSYIVNTINILHILDIVKMIIIMNMSRKDIDRSEYGCIYIVICRNEYKY